MRAKKADKSEIFSRALPMADLLDYLKGAAEIVISGGKHQVKAGEMILMPDGAEHSLQAVERFKMMLVMIRS